MFMYRTRTKNEIILSMRWILNTYIAMNGIHSIWYEIMRHWKSLKCFRTYFNYRISSIAKLLSLINKRTQKRARRLKNKNNFDGICRSTWTSDLSTVNKKNGGKKFIGAINFLFSSKMKNRGLFATSASPPSSWNPYSIGFYRFSSNEKWKFCQILSWKCSFCNH